MLVRGRKGLMALINTKVCVSPGWRQVEETDGREEDWGHYLLRRCRSDPVRLQNLAQEAHRHDAEFKPSNENTK